MHPPAKNSFTNDASVTRGGRIKRLIICCDGTWKSSDQASSKVNNPTNITRLCRALKKAEVHKDITETQQVVYYQTGLGTGAMSAVQKQIAGEKHLFIFT